MSHPAKNFPPVFRWRAQQRSGQGFEALGFTRKKFTMGFSITAAEKPAKHGGFPQWWIYPELCKLTGKMIANYSKLSDFQGKLAMSMRFNEYLSFAWTNLGHVPLWIFVIHRLNWNPNQPIKIWDINKLGGFFFCCPRIQHGETWPSRRKKW